MNCGYSMKLLSTAHCNPSRRPANWVLVSFTHCQFNSLLIEELVAIGKLKPIHELSSKVRLVTNLFLSSVKRAVSRIKEIRINILLNHDTQLAAPKDDRGMKKKLFTFFQILQKNKI